VTANDNRALSDKRFHLPLQRVHPKTSEQPLCLVRRFTR
jgi:hypothetical protein